MRFRRGDLVLGLLVFVLSIWKVDSAAVMSVDLGSQWMKVGVVSPGIPMEIALNKESKRKTPAVIAFKDGVRTFGEDAQNVGVRFPKNSYGYLLDLLGKPFDHPVVKLYQERFPYYDMYADKERGTPVFRYDENTNFTPEELIGQLLAQAKEFAETSTGQTINECVVTVPGFFNQAERLALTDAVRLSGLRLLQLISDHAAVALNYGVFRRKEINETSTYVLFYDIGAWSGKASVVEYKTVKIKERGIVETLPQIQVLGVAFDRTLGGLDMTMKLRDQLGERFMAGTGKGGKNVLKDPRASAKLLKEAERVKLVLSANAEHYAQIEGLIDDKDLRLLVTRTDVEKLWAGVEKKAAELGRRALAAAAIPPEVLRSVVATGGAERTPLLRGAAAPDPGLVSRGLNADEAAALGAVYRAAGLAVGFRVARFLLKDAVLLPIQVHFHRVTEDGTVKQVKRTLFSPMNPFPQKKVITFNKHFEDFSFSVNYAELDHLAPEQISALGSLNISQVHLKGVAEAISKYQDENTESKGIKAHFVMDDSGILQLSNVESVVEKTQIEEEEESSLSKLGNTISKLFGQSSEPNTPTDTNDSSNATSADEQPKVNDTTPQKDAKVNGTEDASKEKKPKVVVLKEPIMAEEEIILLAPISEQQYQASVDKVNALNKADKDRIGRETALNNLESFVIDTQMKLDMDEYSSCGTKTEIGDIKKVCGEVSIWLDEDGYEATTDQFVQKLDLLKEATKSIYSRHWEHKERPDAVQTLNSMLNGSRTFLSNALNMTKEANPEKDVFTAVEIQVLTKAIEDTEKWLNEMTTEQGGLRNYEPVKLTIKSLSEKMHSLDREVKYLVNKLKIWRPKKVETKPEEVIKEENATDSDTISPGEEKAETEPSEGIDSATSLPKDEQPAEPQEETTSEPPLQLEDHREPTHNDEL